MASGLADTARPWTAASSWAPAGEASVDSAVSFETSADDTEAIPSAVLLFRPPSDDGVVSPCEVTINFREMHEIHRVYVRSTARIYEIYYSTDLQNSSKDYLCTVRCGLAAKEEEPLLSSEESDAQCQSGGISTMEKHEQESRSDSSNSDEDSWVEVKIPESPLKNNAADSPRSTNGASQRYTLGFYEATAEIADASPCVALTIRLLSLQSKTSVHIEEIYIFADPFESTCDESVTGHGTVGGSSLLAMLAPSLLQMSNLRSCKIDDKYFCEGSRLQLSEGRTKKESSLSGDMAQAEKPSGMEVSKFKSLEQQFGLNSSDGSMESNEEKGQDACSARDLKLFPSQKQVKENREDMLLPLEQKVPVSDQLKDPLTCENVLAYNRMEKMLDTLVSKVEKIELYCSRFEENMMRPLNRIETRVNQLEQQFDSFTVELVSSHGLRARTSAPEFSCDAAQSQDKATDAYDAGISAPCRWPGLAVKAPDFSVEDCCLSQVKDDTVCGSKMVPELLVKAPEFSCQPDHPSQQLHDHPSSPAGSVSCTAAGPNTCPGLPVKLSECTDGDSTQEVEEGKEGRKEDDHYDIGTKSDVNMQTSAIDSFKCKTRVSIEGALASAFAAFLSSTKATSPIFVDSAISKSSPENINDGSSSSVYHEGVDEIPNKPSLDDQFSGAFGEESKVDALASYENVNALSVTSLPKSNFEDKGCNESDLQNESHSLESKVGDKSCDELDSQNEGHPLDSKVFTSSAEPSELPPQPPMVKESINERAVIIETRSALSLAAFLAARNDNSFNKSVVLNTSNEQPSGAENEVSSFERNSMEGGDNFFKEGSDQNIVQNNGFSQLILLKQALEINEDEGKNVENKHIEAIFQGSNYIAPGNGAYWHNAGAIEANSDENGLGSARHTILLSGESNAFYLPGFSDPYRRGIDDSCSESSLEETLVGPEVPIYWSDVSSTESLGGASSTEAVIFGSTVTSVGNSVNQDDLIPGIGLNSTAIPVAEPREELQKVFGLLSEFQDGILDTTFTRARSTSNPSLELLLCQSSDSGVQVPVHEEVDGDASYSAARLFSASTSDDAASASNKSLVDVDLRKPLETYTGASNAEYPDSLI